MTAQMDHFFSRASVQQLRGCRVSDHENLQQSAEQLGTRQRITQFTPRNPLCRAQPECVFGAPIPVHAPNRCFTNCHAALVRNFYVLFIHSTYSSLFYYSMYAISSAARNNFVSAYLTHTRNHTMETLSCDYVITCAK